MTTFTGTTPRHVQHREPDVTPRLQEFIQRDSAVLSPTFTRSYPFAMSHGRGTEVWDVEGRRFLDFTSGIAVTSTGHAHPRVVKAIQQQAEKFLHMAGMDFYYEVQTALAERLVAITPLGEPGQVFFTNSGTESNEAAIKLARHHTGRPRFIAFLRSFHGRTLGSLGFTSSKPAQRRGFFPLVDGVSHVPYADPYRPVLAMDGFVDYGERVVDYIEHTIFQTIAPADEVAGILLEPIQGEGGYVVPTPGFLPALRALCDRHGILLIVDEVQTGIGRTGRWWGYEHFGVQPDIVTCAKGIASGMPLGAMIARRDVMTWGPGAHGNTFGGNPISCAAALATLDVIEEEGLLDNAAAMGSYMMDCLAEIQPKHPSIGDVRGKGLMVGVDFVIDRATKEPAREWRDAIVAEAFGFGLLILGAGPSTIRLIPPLVVNKAEIDEAIETLDRTITRVEELNR
ncbi:MAG TPA: acetyl ornithine aminotransferase family protein [Aggregatilineales bacterium]|nr:acetyl ornithine aminotransferase family protein [Aggregatilineales bacterium]